MKKNLLLLACFTVFMQINAREVASFNEGWSFNFYDARTLSAGTGMLSRSGAEPVIIPHTWNADDYLSNEGFKRGLGIYSKTFNVPAEDKGKRLFINFEGALLVANVFVNGNFVGEHRGGYTAFTFEITDFVRFGGNNTIIVGIDNSPRYDVSPLGGGFQQIWRHVQGCVADCNRACLHLTTLLRFLRIVHNAKKCFGE